MAQNALMSGRAGLWSVTQGSQEEKQFPWVLPLVKRGLKSWGKRPSKNLLVM